MTNRLLEIATRSLAPLLAVLSLVVLYRGHNLPGGGFIGGLLLASAVILAGLAGGWDKALRRLPATPSTLITIGLAVALASGLPALALGQPFMTGLWLPAAEVPLLGKVKLGTPLLFDIGVYLTVIGFTVQCALALATEENS